MKEEKRIEKSINNTVKAERNNTFFYYSRIILFAVLAVMEILVFVADYSQVFLGIVPQWLVVLGLELLLLISFTLNTFALKSFQQKVATYVLEVITLCLLSLLIDDTYICILYLLFLTEYYVSSKKLQDSLAMAVACLVIFIAMFSVAHWLKSSVNIAEAVTSCVSEIAIIVLHFLIVNFALNMYDSKQALDESNRKLQEAYNELADITILQERQRIARDIHDTAGHSLTTVIMQTEAAKLIVEEDPKEAKRRIVAANLQAKNALKELRESVHLLAGDTTLGSLKAEFEKIIHDSCDGTDVKIRYDIQDVECSSAKRRFFTNCLKEGISNGLRHGHATAFYFEFSVMDGEFNFLLSDNGTGADMSKLKGGFGMRSMKTRAQSYGGEVKYNAFPGEGFEIKMTIPMEIKKTEAEE